MIDDDTFRDLALSLPEALEQDHRGHPSFRVRGKIFATLWPGEHKAVLKIPVADQAGLIEGDPLAFTLNAWSRQGWIDVNLRHVDMALLQELVVTAWRGVAPKTLVKQFDAQGQSKDS